jgi:hypothetical protein
MRRALEILILIFGVVCILIACLHIAIGPSSIPGSVPVNATMDSEDRFYAALFLGFGAALIWCSRDLAAREGVFGALLRLALRELEAERRAFARPYFLRSTAAVAGQEALGCLNARAASARS